eukprot:1063209-Rhodomonas_salina.2
MRSAHPVDPRDRRDRAGREEGKVGRDDLCVAEGHRRVELGLEAVVGGALEDGGEGLGAHDRQRRDDRAHHDVDAHVLFAVLAAQRVHDREPPDKDSKVHRPLHRVDHIRPDPCGFDFDHCSRSIVHDEDDAGDHRDDAGHVDFRELFFEHQRRDEHVGHHSDRADWRDNRGWCVTVCHQIC